MRGLSKREQRMLIAKHLKEGMSFSEVKELLNMEKQTIKNITHENRTKQKLKCFKDDFKKLKGDQGKVRCFY